MDDTAKREATTRQIAAWRKFYGRGGTLEISNYYELGNELDKIIDSLLKRTNPYFDT